MNDQKTVLRIPLRRRLVYGLVTVVVSLGLSLGCVEFVLKIQRQRIAQSDSLDPGMIVYDPQLGWRLEPDFVGSHHHYDFDAEYKINRNGFRGQEFAEASGVKRYAIIGDSFTFGIGVANDQTFVHLLDADSSSDQAFFNFSIPAFSTDQEYLLIGDRVREFHPNVIVLVVYLGNDLFDNQLDFPLQAENAKPYFVLDPNGQLKRRNLPVPMQRKPAAARGTNLGSVVLGDDAALQSFSASLGRLELARRLGLFQDRRQFSDGYFAERFTPALRLFRALVDAIAQVTSEEHAELKLVLLPGKSFLEDGSSVSKQYQDYLRRRIIADFEADSSIDVIDLVGMLRDLDEPGNSVWYFPNEGHLTPEGHRVVARLLADRL